MKSIVCAMRRPSTTMLSVGVPISGGLVGDSTETFSLGSMENFARYVLDFLMRPGASPSVATERTVSAWVPRLMIVPNRRGDHQTWKRPLRKESADATVGRETGARAGVSRQADDEMGNRSGRMLREFRLKRDELITHHGTYEFRDAYTSPRRAALVTNATSPMRHTTLGSIPTMLQTILVQTETSDAPFIHP